MQPCIPEVIVAVVNRDGCHLCQQIIERNILKQPRARKNCGGTTSSSMNSVDVDERRGGDPLSLGRETSRRKNERVGVALDRVLIFTHTQITEAGWSVGG